MKFKQFLEAEVTQPTSNSWLTALVMNGRVIDLNVVAANDAAGALQRAMHYVLPQYRNSIKPMVVTRLSGNDSWRSTFDVQKMGSQGFDNEREAFLRQWFPQFKWN